MLGSRPRKSDICKQDNAEMSEVGESHGVQNGVASCITGRHILIGCTGSVASIKIPVLVNMLLHSSLKPEIKVVATSSSQHFFKKEELAVPVLTDADEWEAWSSIQDPVLHIELRKWADVMLIAPLDANTLAKIANGLCDNLLTCVARAWDPQKPLLFAPAMNTYMWEHPVTATHVATLKSFGYTEVPCISKKLACGDTGYGAMAEVSTLVAALEQALSSQASSLQSVDT